MTIPLPARFDAGPGRAASDAELTPRQIVAELDKYIIGQGAAKKAVAVALRNRFRRRKLPPELADEIAPKNILMIGPTGIGKTEIARRLARLTASPFLKIEASKFTEVGYVGRDVESIIRDLVRIAVDMVRAEKVKEIEIKAAARVEERLLDLLLPAGVPREGEEARAEAERFRDTREKLRQQLREGLLEDRVVELEVRDKAMPNLEVFSNAGMEEVGLQLQELLPGFMGGRTKSRKVKVQEARDLLIEEEERRLVDMDLVARLAVERVEQTGIVFLDELDKVAGRESGRGPDVSREGVQRDLLPIVEGTTVNTRYGLVRTDHILFIGAGAFHVAKPADLIPELQGRFPIRVELAPLTKGDFVRILTEPENALIRQYEALLGTEGVRMEFTADAVDEIASIAERVNQDAENIGARRLHTVMEKVCEEISFEAPDTAPREIRINREYVQDRLRDILQDQDLKRFIL